jgi:hypothetical protein
MFIPTGIPSFISFERLALHATLTPQTALANMPVAGESGVGVVALLQ